MLNTFVKESMHAVHTYVHTQPYTHTFICIIIDFQTQAPDQASLGQTLSNIP